MSAPADATESRIVHSPYGLWLHAVVPAEHPLPHIAGVGGQALRTVRSGDLMAVVSSVPLGEYGEDALRRHLEDLDWLERTARAHHVVVDALSRAGPVVPARLATVYREEGRVAAALAERREEFRAALDRIAGRTEWGVKGFATPAAAGSTADGVAGSGGAGAAYLRRRRAQLMARDAGQRAAANDAAAVHAALSARAVASHRHPPQDRRLSGAGAVMVLNGAYLVTADRAGEFAQLVDELAGRHPAIRLQLTGPWPPYSFIADDRLTETSP
jgi:hypothetical protein